MEWVEITGRTIEEAVDLALDQLGVDEADLQYEVLEEPRRGLLGRLTASARIRARVKPISREKPDRRRRSPARSDRGRSRGPREGKEPRGKEPQEAPAVATAGSRAPAEGTKGEGESQLREGQRRRSRSRSRQSRPARPATTAAAAEGEETAMSGTDVPLSEQVEMAERFTRGLVESFGLDASVAAQPVDEDVKVEITGSDLGFLIGPRAATLDAIQELVRTGLQRRIGGHGARVHVDVDGYRARRHEALAEFAREAARRALESHRDQVFEPMSPGDRKVVHDTVNEIEGVATVSEGEEPRRRVVIRAV